MDTEYVGRAPGLVIGIALAALGVGNVVEDLAQIHSEASAEEGALLVFLEDAEAVGDVLPVPWEGEARELEDEELAKVAVVVRVEALE